MASGCSRQLEDLKLSDSSCGTMGGSKESMSLTASASEAHQATSSSSFLSARGESTVMERAKSGECTSGSGVEETPSCWSSSFLSAVEEHIEQSKSHWSELADQSGCTEEGEGRAEVSNVEVFKDLQRHPTWGRFFRTLYGEDENVYDSGEMEVGAKFAEGGQAELYDAQVTWWNPENNEEDLRDGAKYVLKVFKKGTFLKHLIPQMPQGLLQFFAERQKNHESLSPKVMPTYTSDVMRGTLLKDGRFALLMVKQHSDLRGLIERNMKLRSVEDSGPFSKDETEFIMYDVALGGNWLHDRGIVHRDLKASNVLVQEFGSGYYPRWRCYVADYECSIGVVGTGFFRAPEILEVCKDGKSSQRHEVFSRAGDVYAYGMTCYEILTGKLPFEDHPLSGNWPLLTDLVINQHLRPEIPEYVAEWSRELLRRCWQADPTTRPSFEEILDVLSVKSAIVREDDEYKKRKYGEDFRIWRLTDI